MLKKTKIISTIGPATSSYQMLKKLAEAGMDVARLNFSHGVHEEKAEQIRYVRKVSQELNKPIGVFADLQGPKLRLGLIDGKVEINKGDLVKVSVNPKDIDTLPMQFDLAPFLKTGQRVYLNDALVELRVKNVKGDIIEAVAQNSGWVSSNKGVNVPDTHLSGAAFTKKDEEDAIFALKNNVDYLALSFVQTVDDLIRPKQLIKQYSPDTKIIVKVEKPQAVTNIEEIIKATDAIMIARGDLAIETQASEVPIIQQKIIKLGRQYQKTVFVATQMLESMIENPRPTRAETSDVANAVLDQVDGVMTSAETASGKYPIEVVQTMKNIINSVESHPDYKRSFKINWESLEKEQVSYSALTSSAATLAYRIKAKVIVLPTFSGKSAKLLSSFRPDATIVTVTHDEKVRNQLTLVWGINPFLVKLTKNYHELLDATIDSVIKGGFAKKGDQIVIIIGSHVGESGATDTIRVITL